MSGRPRRPIWRRCSMLRGRASIHPVLVSLAVGLLLGAVVIGVLEAKLGPIVSTAAQAQIQNNVTSVLEQAISADLVQRQVSYDDLVTIQRNDSGAITALSTDVAEMNLLRTELTSCVLAALDGIDLSTVAVPLGSLFDLEVLWARGPSIQARAMSVGTVSAEFNSEFVSAGVNQTLHRIWLEIDVPMTVLLPGGPVQTPVHMQLLVAETVIVGQVPDTYLQFGGT